MNSLFSAPAGFGVLNVVAGVGFALAGTPWLAPFVLPLFASLQPGADPSLADTPMARWAWGIVGGVMAGWGVHLWAQARGWAPGHAALLGLAVWFTLDSALSALNGAYANVAVNVVWLGMGAAAYRGRA